MLEKIFAGMMFVFGMIILLVGINIVSIDFISFLNSIVVFLSQFTLDGMNFNNTTDFIIDFIDNSIGVFGIIILLIAGYYLFLGYYFFNNSDKLFKQKSIGKNIWNGINIFQLALIILQFTIFFIFIFGSLYISSSYNKKVHNYIVTETSTNIKVIKNTFNKALFDINFKEVNEIEEGIEDISYEGIKNISILLYGFFLVVGGFYFFIPTLLFFISSSIYKKYYTEEEKNIIL